jgi:hypothetical protein
MIQNNEDFSRTIVAILLCSIISTAFSGSHIDFTCFPRIIVQ